jgi:hypothetical protein
VGEVDHFSVTVSRVNESANVDPYFTMNAYSLTVEADGSLSITGEQKAVGFPRASGTVSESCDL